MFDSQVSVKIAFILKNAKRFSLLVMVGFLALGAVCGLSLSKLKTEYSMKQFLPPNHPLIEADDKTKARFQLPDFEPFFALVTLGDHLPGTWLEGDKITRLHAVTEGLKSQPRVRKTLSLGNVEGASQSKEGLTVGRLLELTPESQWSARVLTDPLLTPGLISEDGRTAVVAVWLEEGTSQQVTEAVQLEARKQLTETFAGATVRLGGVPAVQVEMSNVLGRELGNFLVLSLLASLLTLLVFFRTWSSVGIALFLMLLANVICLGFMAIAGIPFSVLSSTLPVLVSLTVVSMSTHTMMRYASDWQLAQRMSANPNPLRVLLHSYHGLLGPNTLTAITTSIGFFAISIANIPLIRQYGYTVGISIFVCWFTVMGALLPLLALSPVPLVRDWTNRRARWALLVARYSRHVVAAVAVLCAGFLYAGKDLNWSARLFDDLPQGYEARAATELVDRQLGGMIPFDLVIEKDEADAWNDPQALARLDKFAKKMRSHEYVGSVVGPQDLLRAAGKVQGRDLASTRAEAAEYAFLYSMGENDILKSFVTVDGKAARLNMRLHDIPADKMKAFVGEVKAEAEGIFPGYKITPAAMATTVHELNNELCYELIYGFWQALAAISLVLLCVFRSVRWTLAAAIPNLVPVVILMGALAIFGTPIKPGIALIFSIALGISFDNTVYLLGRLRLLRARSETGAISVGKAWYQEANLCLFSSIALASGFLVFLASFFSLNQQFGFYMVVTILGGLVGDLFLLPAMLEAFPWMVKDKKAKRSAKIGEPAVVGQKIQDVQNVPELASGQLIELHPSRQKDEERLAA